MMRFTAVSAVIVVLAACSSSSSTQTSSAPAIARQRGDAIMETYEGGVRETDVLLRTYTLAAPPADVLNALAAAYENAGISIATRDPKQGLIGNTNFRVTGKLKDRQMSDFIVCPPISSAPMLENTWFINMSVVTVVTGDGGNSKIQTAVQASAKNPHGSSNPFRCESRGALERLIANATALELGVSLGR